MPADITFTSGPDGTITARPRSYLPDSTHRLLEQNGAQRTATDRYTFSGPDAVAQAARSAFLLDAGGLQVETGSEPREQPAPVAQVDVVFAKHPTDGIVAATTTNATVGLIPDVLAKFGFRYDGSAPDRDIYLPPTGHSERQALVSAARASLVLQKLGFQVATRGLATPPASADRLAEAAEDLVAERISIRSLTASGDVADLLDAATDERTGALVHLSALLDDIGQWAGALPIGEGQQLEGRIDEARIATEELLTGLTDLRQELAALDAVVEAPVASLRSTRASAATAATARGAMAGPILQASGAAHAVAAVPQSTPSHAASL